MWYNIAPSGSVPAVGAWGKARSVATKSTDQIKSLCEERGHREKTEAPDT